MYFPPSIADITSQVRLQKADGAKIVEMSNFLFGNFFPNPRAYEMEYNRGVDDNKRTVTTLSCTWQQGIRFGHYMSSCQFSFSFIGHILAYIKIWHNPVTFLLLTTNTALQNIRGTNRRRKHNFFPFFSKYLFKNKEPNGFKATHWNIKSSVCLGDIWILLSNVAYKISIFLSRFQKPFERTYFCRVDLKGIVFTRGLYQLLTREM